MSGGIKAAIGPHPPTPAPIFLDPPGLVPTGRVFNLRPFFQAPVCVAAVGNVVAPLAFGLYGLGEHADNSVVGEKLWVPKLSSRQRT
jgi:hypothetical protein